VVENPRSITVETYGGTKHKATVLGMDEWQDIAVLIVEGATFPYLEVADLSAMKTGDDIYAIGAPRGMAYTLTKGGISAKERVVSGQTYIQIDAPINQGNSGGPLLNDAGQVLGVNTLKRSDSEGIGFAIPITRVCEYLESLGVALDATGNVVGNPGGSPQPSTDSPEGTDPTNHQEESKSDENHPEYPNPEGPDNTSTIAAVAVIVAALSLATNVVLAVLWIHERKKSVAVPCDPSERTDFEIDIWE
jgi:serine protease Do